MGDTAGQRPQSFHLLGALQALLQSLLYRIIADAFYGGENLTLVIAEHGRSSRNMDISGLQMRK